ncbi:MAG TPA: DUF4157 domain-containing protein, partial [Thermomicrobiales bacterium]|nr:DUF4157 domain-containing protein [Thermomicrobiales bacterium]
MAFLRTRSPRTHSTTPVLDCGHKDIRTAGSRLAPQLISQFAHRFGHDFGNVRIHTGPMAAESARAHHAHAYTVGRDIVFAAGAYRPHTPAGHWLLAHELAHVIQQGQRSISPGASVADGGPRAAEREARAAATAAMTGGAPAAVTQRVAGPVVQKQDAGTDEPAPVPVPTQAPSGRWSTRDLSIALRSSKARTHEGGTGSGCMGFARPGSLQAFSACGRIEEFCATPAVYPFRVWFHVDSRGLPRPQPFRSPAVEVIWQFTGVTGATQNGRLRDAAPK